MDNNIKPAKIRKHKKRYKLKPLFDLDITIETDKQNKFGITACVEGMSNVLSSTRSTPYKKTRKISTGRLEKLQLQ